MFQFTNFYWIRIMYAKHNDYIFTQMLRCATLTQFRFVRSSAQVCFFFCFFTEIQYMNSKHLQLLLQMSVVLLLSS